MAGSATNFTGASSAFGTLPVLKEERQLGLLDHSWVNIGIAVATWAFLLGGTTAMFVGARDGIAAIIIGNVIGVAIVSVSVCLGTSKYGVEQFTFARSVFGRAGVLMLVCIFLAIYGVGWSSVLAIMFGRAISEVTNSTAGTTIGPNDLGVTAFAIIAIAVSWVLLWKGPTAVKWLNRIVGPGKLALCAGILILLFAEKSWSAIAAAAPLQPFDDPSTNFMVAVEINLAASFGWWPILGNIARFTKTPRAALWPNITGIFAAAVVGEVIGLLAALSLGNFDPTAWMIPLGGMTIGVIALLFIGLANITAIVSIFYGMCLAMRQAGGRRFENIPWGVLTGALFIPVIIVSFFPAQIYDNFFVFLAWTALGFAPLSGVTAVDYILLRRGQVNSRDLYRDEPGTDYAFWGGVNWIAFIALIVGGLVYYALFNPLSLTAHNALFNVISASVPSCIAAGLVHYVLTKSLLRPGGRGGYAA
ncbi:purine-cytosine permease family protein [Hyphomicrobium facile]|uniref:Nucleobase:cation symporter-1, NCS1 family n=1 Tax=Hyphomicrobium facile TaxID=51670 RepID=A0A1I7MZ38_9HYPH|nr:cytosine permease [Hyphomicrobium facile]SFV27586.1 nucleobase:cation symporter-1, NCS1 family [Hyphomicrobium facile]